jgi:hypothetical protein
MSSVFGRLGFDFDTAAFGDAQYLTPAALKTLNVSPTILPSWQVEAIASGPVHVSDYLKNPLANVCDTLLANTTAIHTITTNDPANTFPLIGNFENLYALSTAASNYMVQLSAFKSHTNNISGVGVQSSNTFIPNYDLAVSVGQQILRITNTTDGIANSTPMMGSFTSLYVGDALAANNVTIHNDYVTVSSLVDIGGNCNLTDTQVNTIISHINSANNLIATRRTHDWNFYSNSVKVINDYLFLNKFTNLGNTQTYLVNNFIGTERLVNILANT